MALANELPHRKKPVNLTVDENLLKEAQVLIEMWRKQYNTVRPHSALGYRPPAPATIYIQPAKVQPVGLTL